MHASEAFFKCLAKSRIVVVFVFIDEKWFYLTQKSEKYYLLPEEDDPHRTCKNKNYIPRLMFLCSAKV